MLANMIKRDARVSFPPFSWGTKLPLIGQTVNTIIPAILPWAVWPIRGPVVPHENWRENALSALFCNVFYSKVIKIKF